MSLVEYAKKECQVNVGKSKVMRCSTYVNVDRIDARLNAIEEVDCFKYLGSQVSGGGCEWDVRYRMNEGHKT